MTYGIFEWVGPNRALSVLGVKLVGVTAENGKKLLLTLGFIAAAMLLRLVLKHLSDIFVRGEGREHARFWTHQGIRLSTTVIMLVGIVSIWFEDPTRLTTAAGLVSAGLAFALQKVVTAVAGYFVILRGKPFNVGDRITMGGVRGDVMDIGFVRTTIMEMGQPPAVQDADPAMWVHARQYTGRIVTVTNDKVFDEPIYNYSREFPYIWEEMSLPVRYSDDFRRVEKILLDAASRHIVDVKEISMSDLEELKRRYFLRSTDLGPKVYFRLTDNWIELTVRFVTRTHGVRDLKDALSREILDALNEAGIGIASATFDVVGLPPVRIELPPDLRNKAA